MTPTPEQLQAWGEEFHKAFPSRKLSLPHQEPNNSDYVLCGYLRARTEQASEIAELKAELAGAEAEIAALKQGLHRTEKLIKDARKQAIEDCANFAKDWAMEHIIEDDATISIQDYITEATITKLLKD